MVAAARRAALRRCADATAGFTEIIKQMNDSNDTKSSAACAESCNCDYTLAFLVLRLWLAVRAILAGVEKYGTYHVTQKPLVDPVTGMDDPSGAMIDVKIKAYSMTNYTGVPAPLKDKFVNEPMLPHSALNLFDHVLGPALIVTGVMLLLGLGTRVSLFLQGLIYIALTVGLILIKQEDGVAWLGIHVALVAFALMLAGHNKLALLKKW
jgi:thiosulfate dehydrogenase [quinone] large subunit